MALPLMLSNVLVQHFIAQGKHQVLPWLLLILFVYGLALWCQKSSLLQAPQLFAYKRIIATFGAFNLMFFAVALCFNHGLRTTPVGLCNGVRSDPASVA